MSTQKTGAGVDGLRPCKRYIATHDSNGTSVYADSPAQVFNVTSGAGLSRSYAVGSVPAKLANDEDVAAYRGETGPTSYTKQNIVPSTETGANLLVIDLAPGAVSAMHRTVSIDFSVCVQGEIDHELDGGEKVRLYPGDHIVQRGTNHRWSNPSKTEPARFVATTIPCVPFDIAGKPLKEVHVPSEEWDRKSKM